MCFIRRLTQISSSYIIFCKTKIPEAGVLLLADYIFFKGVPKKKKVQIIRNSVPGGLGEGAV